MYPTSDKFLATIKKPHRMVLKAEVLEDGDVTETLDLTRGSVSVSDEKIRRRCRVTLADPDGSLTPHDLTSLLAPNGNEIRLWRGVVLDDADPIFDLAAGDDEWQEGTLTGDVTVSNGTLTLT